MVRNRAYDGDVRLHLVSLPHTQTTAEYVACAYTSKVVKGARMFKEAGHEVFVYSGEENEAPCDEHITIIEKHEQEAYWGKPNLSQFFPDIWDASADWWSTTNARAGKAIARRARPGDLVLILGGVCQQGVADFAHPAGAEVIEWGVGYFGIWSRCIAFESYSHMHNVYSDQGWQDGRFYDAVVPNFFDVDEFPLVNDGTGEYLLYVGRLNVRKGLKVVEAIANATGLPLVVAGQGARAYGPGFLTSDEVSIKVPSMDYVGVVNVAERAELMAGARALLCPTVYIEPFGGVNVEAQIAGTPVITTDWGAFTETVEQGVSGYRCRLLKEFVQAVYDVQGLDPAVIRQRAIDRYSLDAVGDLFDVWFKRIHTLWGTGWDEMGDPTFPSERMVAA